MTQCIFDRRLLLSLCSLNQGKFIIRRKREDVVRSQVEILDPSKGKTRKSYEKRITLSKVCF